MTDKPDLPWDDSIAPPWRTVSTGPGWYPIIAKLDQDLRKVAPDYRVLQVKEKFGGLRYYTIFPSANWLDIKDQVNPLTRAAEAEANRTCEECGQTGRLRNDRRWIRTLCDEDAAKRPPDYSFEDEDEDED